jgi:hypothetical protein
VIRVLMRKSAALSAWAAARGPVEPTIYNRLPRRLSRYARMACMAVG